MAQANEVARMAITDSKRRELCSLLTFRQQFDSVEPEQCVGLLMETLAVTRKNVYDAITWWEGSKETLKAAREALQSISHSYAIERLGEVERAILMTAADELMREPSQGKRVINDAIRLARKYATPEAGALVNALLDGLCQRLQGANVDEKSIVTSAQALEQAEADAHHILQTHHQGSGSAL